MAKTSYSYELSVAKRSNMSSVAKSRAVEPSVAKSDVRHCTDIATASLASADVHC